MTPKKAKNARVQRRAGLERKNARATRVDFGRRERMFSPQRHEDRRIGNAATAHERQECAAVSPRRER
jgi:hypothetical protein